MTQPATTITNPYAKTLGYLSLLVLATGVIILLVANAKSYAAGELPLVGGSVTALGAVIGLTWLHAKAIAWRP